jgi:glycosyltransferase involved in cell wall biosynthesis
MMLKALKILRGSVPAKLLVLGEGEDRAQLESLARALGVAPYVEFAGYQSNPYKFMARASAFVMSSAWEGFGNVLVEAMACGTPVVSTDCPSGPVEILDSGRFGMLTPVGDPEAFASAIRATLENPRSQQRLIARASEFSVDAAVEKYRAVLGV